MFTQQYAMNLEQAVRISTCVWKEYRHSCIQAEAHNRVNV
jgi:hypothetical protein